MQSDIVTTARQLAKSSCRIVRVGKLLRSDGYVINGQLFQTDVAVYPNGHMVPTTCAGRKLVEKYV